MSHKSHKISELIRDLQDADLDAHYLGYFECFNRHLYFEAHEVLEELWLLERGRTDDLFYKGLIQLAGAFVHLQKRRPGPAAALCRLARANLARYPSPYRRLETASILITIDLWLDKLARAPSPATVWDPVDFPRLALLPRLLEHQTEAPLELKEPSSGAN